MSQDASARSTRLSTPSSWHSSAPSVISQPSPQISTGIFVHLVSPINFPGLSSTLLVEQDVSNSSLHFFNPSPLQVFSNGLLHFLIVSLDASFLKVMWQLFSKFSSHISCCPGL